MLFWKHVKVKLRIVERKREKCIYWEEGEKSRVFEIGDNILRNKDLPTEIISKN